MEVGVLSRRKPLLFLRSDLNGRRGGFEPQRSQVRCLRTKLNMLKTRGMPAAKNKLRFTRTGSIFFVASHSVLGLKGRIWSQVVGGQAPVDSALPPKVVISCRRDSSSAKKVAFCVDETTLDFASVHFV